MAAGRPVPRLQLLPEPDRAARRSSPGCSAWPPLDVFRVCFQLIFALVPVGAPADRPPAAAHRRPRCCSAGLFVAFPTFVNDMPMLNRQEIALLFFVVGLLALLDARGRRRHRDALVLSPRPA